jgi:hypothetical protein
LGNVDALIPVAVIDTVRRVDPAHPVRDDRGVYAPSGSQKPYMERRVVDRPDFASIFAESSYCATISE